MYISGEGVNLSCNSTAQRLKGTLTKYIDMLHVFLNFCYVHLSKLLGVYFIEEVNLSCNCTAQKRGGFWPIHWQVTFFSQYFTIILQYFVTFHNKTCLETTQHKFERDFTCYLYNFLFTIFQLSAHRNWSICFCIIHTKGHQFQNDNPNLLFSS